MTSRAGSMRETCVSLVHGRWQPPCIFSLSSVSCHDPYCPFAVRAAEFVFLPQGSFEKTRTTGLLRRESPVDRWRTPCHDDMIVMSLVTEIGQCTAISAPGIRSYTDCKTFLVSAQRTPLQQPSGNQQSLTSHNMS